MPRRGSKAAAVEADEPTSPAVATSPSPPAARRRSTRGASPAADKATATASASKNNKKSTAKSAFDFDAEDEDEENDAASPAAEKTKQQSKRQTKSVKATAERKSNRSPSPAASKSSSKKNGASSSKKKKSTKGETKEEEEEEEESEPEEEEAEEEEQKSSSMSQRQVSRASQIDPSQVMSAEAIKACIGNKDQLLKALKRLLAHLDSLGKESRNAGVENELAVLMLDRGISKNKSQEIRALSACVLLDLMKRQGAKSPFSESQLKDIYGRFTEQLANLSMAANANMNLYTFLLETLAATKITTQLIHIDGGELQIHGMFELFFALAKHDLPDKSYEHMMIIMHDILTAYNDALPALLLDEMLQHLTKAKIEENEGGAKLAVDLIAKSAEQLERPITRWLKSQLIDEESELDTGITEHEDHINILAQLYIHCNDAVRGFHRYALDLLQVEDEDLREEYTRTFGRVFSSANISSYHPDVMQANQELFNTFLKRFIDRSPKVRTAIAQSCGEVLLQQIHNQQNRESMHNYICDTAADLQETVRFAILESMHQAAMAQPDSINSRILGVMIMRIRDKKPAVRSCAVRSLGELFSHHCAKFWRQMSASPKEVNMYLSIPRRLICGVPYDRQLALLVEQMIDQHVLGTDESIEMRTKALLGLWLSLVEKSRGGEETSKPISTLADSIDPNELPTPDRFEARKLFTNILQGKAVLQRAVNELLVIHQRGLTAKTAGDQAEFDRSEHTKRSIVANIAKRLSHPGDPTLDDLTAQLYSILFDSKDKNIHKYLRALANPLTEYAQIRLAQSQLRSCIKSMTSAQTTANKNKKTLSSVTLIDRLSQNLSLVFIPLESVEMLYRQIASYVSEKRLLLLRPCQELLQMISKSFPLLLTHPNTIQTLYESLTKVNDDENTIITLDLLTRCEPKLMHASKKHAGQFLEELKRIAQTGTFESSQLAVECIQRHWGAPPKSAAEEPSSPSSLSTPSTEADRVLKDIFAHHADQNLDVESASLPAALGVASKLPLVNFAVFQHYAVTQRKQTLQYILVELLNTTSIVEYSKLREYSLHVIQNYLVTFGQVNQSLEEKVDISTNGTVSVDATTPRNLVTTLTKIVKLDGRYPDSNLSTVQQLAKVDSESESEDQFEARQSFLLRVGLALVECGTVSVFHRFFLHAQQPAIDQYDRRREEAHAAATGAVASPQKAPRDGDLSNLFSSPKTTPKKPAGEPVKKNTVMRYPFQFLPIAYLANSPLPEFSRQFSVRVRELIHDRRLPFSIWTATLVLAKNHPVKHVQHLQQHAMQVLCRRQREFALIAERQHAAKEQQRIDATTAAAMSVGKSASKKKKKGGRKSKKAEEDEEEEEDEDENEAPRVGRTANALLPEYAIADLVYILSYHPQFIDHLGLKPTKTDKDNLKEIYREMLGYIDFFLDCLLHDPPTEGGRNFNLLLAILTKIRQSEDIRDPANVKVYKLAELAIQSVQRRMSHEKWSTDRYDDVLLSGAMWRPSLRQTKEQYLPEEFNLAHLTSHTSSSASVGDDNKTTPKRKRRTSEGEPSAKRRHKSPSSTVSDDDDEADGGSARKRKSSASKPKKEKVPAEPTRSRLSRGAKSQDITYDENAASDVDMDEDDEVIIKRKPAKRAPKSDDEEADEDGDIDMTRSPAPPSKKQQKKPTPTKRRKEESDKEDEDEDEEEESESRSHKKKKTKLNGDSKQTTVKESPKKPTKSPKKK